jgi:hypothetical protein
MRSMVPWSLAAFEVCVPGLVGCESSLHGCAFGGQSTPMDSALRIVTTIPVTVLWNDPGELAAVRDRYLTTASIKDLLKTGPIQFVVADVGTPLRWIEKEACYDFWKRQVEPYVSDPDDVISLDRLPGGFAYLASLWTQSDRPSLILLEAIH